MVYSQARRSLPSRNCPAEADGPEKGLLGQFLRYSAVPAQAQEVPLKLRKYSS